MGKRKSTSGEATAARKPQVGSAASNEDEAKLLGFFLQYHMDERKDVTFEVAAADLDCHKSNNRWRAVWKSLKEQDLLQKAASGTGFEISEKGIKQAETAEYKAFLKDKNHVATSNEEYQERLKARLKRKKSAVIFDLLLRHGSLSRYELAGLVGEKDRSHAFSYSLQELRKTNGFVEHDPNIKGKHKKLRLSDKAFLKPQDRPGPEELDAQVLAKAAADNKAPREGAKKKAAAESKVTSTKKSKKGGSGKEENEEVEVEN